MFTGWDVLACTLDISLPQRTQNLVFDKLTLNYTKCVILNTGLLLWKNIRASSSKTRHYLATFGKELVKIGQGQQRLKETGMEIFPSIRTQTNINSIVILSKRSM